MHDHEWAVEHNPLRVLHTFCGEGRKARARYFLSEVIRHGADMAARGAAGDNHVISDVAFAFKWNADNFLGFIAFKRFRDQGLKKPCPRRDSGYFTSHVTSFVSLNPKVLIIYQYLILFLIVRQRIIGADI